MNELRIVKVNPLRIVSAILLVVSPFLSWITVSFFGLTVESTLVDISRSDVHLQVPENLALISTITAIVLILAGLAQLKTAKIGLPLAVVGLVPYLYASSSVYGAPVSVIPIIIAPGLGLLISLASIVIGAVSLRVQPQTLDVMLQKFKTRQGITGVGLFLAAVALSLDGLNHAGQRELSSFTGIGIVEPIFHIGFILSITLLTILFSLRKRWASIQANTLIVGVAFMLVLLDAAYHLSTGEVSGFLGHDPTELLLHASAYYGTAFLVIGRLVR